MEQHFPEKRLVNAVEGLMEIQFQNHRSFRAPHFGHGIDGLLGEDNVIRSGSSWNEASLERADQVVKHRSQPVNNQFSKNLISDIKKRDRPKLINRVRVRFFWN